MHGVSQNSGMPVPRISARIQINVGACGRIHTYRGRIHIYVHTHVWHHTMVLYSGIVLKCRCTCLERMFAHIIICV
jgi:hypothetical protein